MPFVPTNGITTYYETSGAGEPLVLLHNDALSLEVWQRLIPQLAAHSRLIAYDRRGHGQSEIPSPETPYTLETLAEDLRALLDALGIRSARLFGCSGGANVALAFTLDCPDRVSRLILAEPPIMGLRRAPPVDTADLSSHTAARIMREQDLEAGLDYWFRTVLSPTKAKALLRGRYRPLLLSRPPWLIQAILRSAEGFDPGPRLSEVRQPVLLVQGSKTHRLFSDVTTVLESRLPRARLLVLPGVDHAGLLVPSASLLPVVQAFLSDDVTAV